MSKVLITGGLGFIGAALVRECLKEGHKVRVLDNKFRGRESRLQDVLSKIDLLEGDITDPQIARLACREQDWVFHLAAINGTKYFYEIPHEVLAVNVKGTIHILEAAQAEGCSRFLFSSSSELYHQPRVIPTPETVKITIPDVRNPRFSYAGSKLIGELFCLHQPPGVKMKTIVIRYHNIYGPDMGSAHVIPELFAKIQKTQLDFNGIKKIEIQGTGEETRAFCYVDDAVKGTLLAMTHGKDREIYHIGTQDEISIADLIEQMAQVLNVKVQILHGPVREGGTKRRCPNISKLKGLGYQPQVSLKDGLRQTLNWYQKHSEAQVKEKIAHD